MHFEPVTNEKRLSVSYAVLEWQETKALRCNFKIFNELEMFSFWRISRVVRRHRWQHCWSVNQISNKIKEDTKVFCMGLCIHAQMSSSYCKKHIQDRTKGQIVWQFEKKNINYFHISICSLKADLELRTLFVDGSDLHWDDRLRPVFWSQIRLQWAEFLLFYFKIQKYAYYKSSSLEIIYF